MKKLIFILFFFLGLSVASCQICNEKPLGRYYCSNFNNAENYIEFKDDGTYYHFFKNDSIELANSGEWHIRKDNNCIIELYDYKNFNDEGSNYEDFGIYLLWINNDYLDNSPDGESSTSFKRKN